MSRARSEHTDNLILIAATTLVILSAQRYFRTFAPEPLDPATPEPRSPAATKDGNFTRELAQHGHGRRARSPFSIPWAGWKDILWRTYDEFNDDRLLATAAGVVFFGLLAVFPAVTALVSSYGLFADPSTIGANLQTLAVMLPEGSFQIVQEQIARVLEKGSTALGWTFLFGLGLALWSANAGVKAVIDALNVVYDEREKRSFIGLNLLSLSFTVGGIAALMVMVGAVVAFPLALDHLGLVGLAPDSLLIVSLARWPLLFAALLTALAFLYRFGPSRRAPRWEAWYRHAACRPAVDRRFRGAILVSVELRRLQCDLRFARRRHRPDDVDVDVGHRRAVRGGAELGNRAPDRGRYHRRPSKAAGQPRCRHGRYAGTGGSSLPERTLDLQINIDAKVIALGGAQTGRCLTTSAFSRVG